MPEPLTYLERLREIALDQHGYVTAVQAVEQGIPGVELVKLASRDRIERVAHGVYRIPQVPEAPPRRVGVGGAVDRRRGGVPESRDRVGGVGHQLHQP